MVFETNRNSRGWRCERFFCSTIVFCSIVLSYIKHTLNRYFQVRQILTQFEYIAQDTNSAAAHINSEEIVWLAVQRSVAGLLKTSAVDRFYDEVSLYLVDSTQNLKMYILNSRK